MQRSRLLFAVLFVLMFAHMTFALDNGNKDQSGKGSDFYELSWDGPVEIATIRAGRITRLGRQDIQNVEFDQEAPSLLMFADSIAQEGGDVFADNCRFLIHYRHTAIRGEASRFHFDGNTQHVHLDDAKLRMSVAVAGRDLTDLSAMKAKAMAIDMKSSRVHAESTSTTVDFSARNP